MIRILKSFALVNELSLIKTLNRTDDDDESVESLHIGHFRLPSSGHRKEGGREALLFVALLA